MVPNCKIIYNIKRCVKGDEGISQGSLLATKSDIFATKEDMRLGNARFILIGHSNGGLVSRYYIENLGGDVNVDKLITIDTPHYGSNTYFLSAISTTLMEMGIHSSLAKPLDAELRPASSLFTGNRTNYYDFANSLIVPSAPLQFLLGSLYFNCLYDDSTLQYIQFNQSRILKGNSKVRTKYYAIGGMVFDGERPEELRSGTMFCEIKPDYTTEASFINSITYAFSDKYQDSWVTINDASCNDNVVEIYSQLGVKFNISLFATGTVNQKINFDGMTLFYTEDIKYNNKVIGLINGIMYHMDILDDNDLRKQLIKYIER